MENDEIAVDVAVDRGSDLVGLIDLRTGIDVLFRSPWAARAHEVRRRGSRLWHPGSAEAWLESYPGGWQLLCPNAGDPRVRAGIQQGFHGEAAVVPWAIDAVEPARLDLHVSLYTAPLEISRSITLEGACVRVADTVRNASPVPVNFDYQHHPAFGAPLLSSACVIETGAQTFVVDPEGQWEDFVPGSAHTWPEVATRSGTSVRMDVLPASGEKRAVLGWLTDFDGAWVALRNPALDLAVALSWDAGVLPHAWFWQELTSSPGFPWYQRAYVVAAEPSTTCTSGAGRARTMDLDAGASVDIVVRASVGRGSEIIESVDEAGEIRYRGRSAE